MEFNPWKVLSLEAFNYYCCPECEDRYKSKEQFVFHAIEEHPKAREVMPGIIDGNIYMPTVPAEPVTNMKPVTSVTPRARAPIVPSIMKKSPLPIIEESDHDIDQDYDTPISNYNVQSDSEYHDEEVKSDPETDIENNVDSFRVEPLIGIEETNGNHEPMKVEQDKINQTDQESKNEYQCDQCPKSFKVEKSLKIHVRSVHEGILFHCEQCSSKYPRKQELKAHIQQEHEGLTFLCTLCGKSLSNSKSLKIHMERHESVRVTYKCEQCGKILHSKRSLERHTKCTHEGIYYKELMKNTKPFRNPPKKKVKIEPEDQGPFQCHKCPKTFKLPRSLKIHIRSIHEGLLFHCEQCPATFSTKGHLNQHMKAAHEGRSFLCNLCGKSLSNSNSLRVHINEVHGGVTYNCKQCDKVFHSFSSLGKHVKSIHDKMTYTCEHCGKISKSKEKLKHHIRFVHEGITFKCDKCDKEFPTNYALGNHFESTHEGMTYKCALCSKICPTKSALYNHVSRIHNKAKINDS